MTFRFARHTNNLEQLKSFYIDVLGLELLGGFENHHGYDGIFIGNPAENWHLEFTKSNEVVSFSFSEEDLLVFYPNTQLEFDAIIDQLQKNKIECKESQNPYWNVNGKMVLDPDGYRVVISNLKIK